MNDKNCIVLTHPFKDKIPNINEFCQAENEVGVIHTVNAFCNRVNKLSDKYGLTIPENDFKGGAFELLVEYLCKTNASDNRIGIYDYKPVIGQEDNGVDGYGKGENTFPATVQAKFRSGEYVLTANADSLTNFLASSWKKYNVLMDDDKNMLIITTALKLDERTRENMLYNSVRVLNREALREMLDNRPEWWTRFYETLKLSVIKSEITTPLTLRQHQTEACDSIGNNTIGKIILPTGTGKTRIEAELIRRTIVEKLSLGVVPVIKVNSSRILLCFQLFEDCFKYLSSHGIKARYINFNSGTADESNYIAELAKKGEAYREIVSTTSPFEVVKTYQKAVTEGISLIIFSTYHSSEKCAESNVIPNLTINDEGHNLVSSAFSRVAKLPSEKKFFVTATEKITDSDEDLGMNNPEIFGEILYTKSPKAMIEVGEMVSPMVHVVRARAGQTINLNNLEQDYDALASSVFDAFLAHQRKLRQTSSDASKLGAKILVVCRGQQDLMEMHKSGFFNELRSQNPDINIAALSSEFGTYLNGVKENPPVSNIKKYKLLEFIKGLAPEAKLIVFHVDMIGEGIDVPGLTGVMPFRNCELAKFIQNIGRASRLHPLDRAELYKNNLSVEDKSKWIKPSSWVIIPTFLENSEGFAGRFREIINKLRTDFGYIPQQHTLIDNPNGLSDDAIIDAVNAIEKNRPHRDSGLEEFEHVFENMTLIERILFDDEVLQLEEQYSKEIDDLLK